jgi:hypothetical protein
MKSRLFEIAGVEKQGSPSSQVKVDFQSSPLATKLTTPFVSMTTIRLSTATGDA